MAQHTQTWTGLSQNLKHQKPHKYLQNQAVEILQCFLAACSCNMIITTPDVPFTHSSLLSPLIYAQSELFCYASQNPKALLFPSPGLMLWFFPHIHTHIIQWSIKATNCYQTSAKVHKTVPTLERNTRQGFMENHYKINLYVTIINLIIYPFLNSWLIGLELQSLLYN